MIHIANALQTTVDGAVPRLRALSDSHPVATQGPVWYIGGRAV